MSSVKEGLPSKSAPLAERLAAAMTRAGYRAGSKEGIRKLGRELGTDGGLISKWLNGRVKRITLESHLDRLPELLDTPPDYFRDDPPQPRREEFVEMAELVEVLREDVDDAVRRIAVLERRADRGSPEGETGEEHS